MQPLPPEPPPTPIPPNAHGRGNSAPRTGSGHSGDGDHRDPRPDTPPALAFSNVTLAPGARAVLRDASFSVRQGEFIGVLGPNGAGKTTLMRAALGLVPAARGTIHVLGEAVALKRRGNPSVGYMPQTRSALASRRVRGRDFVAMAANGHRWGLPLKSAATRADVERALALVDARALAERTLAELSGGERQRLLLAQCLLGQPRLLLLDEPLISLDPHHQRGVVELVRRVQRELGIAVLFSAHELNPLLDALDRVLYLGNGAAALGSVDEVITAPVLSRLYGAPIDVMRTHGRIFVMSGGVEIDKHDHGHEHDEHGHGGHGGGHGGHHEHGQRDGLAHDQHGGQVHEHKEHGHDERGRGEHRHDRHDGYSHQHDEPAHERSKQGYDEHGHGERRHDAHDPHGGRTHEHDEHGHGGHGHEHGRHDDGHGDAHDHHDAHAHDDSRDESRNPALAHPPMTGHPAAPATAQRDAHDARDARAIPPHDNTANRTTPASPAAPAHCPPSRAPHPHPPVHPHNSTPDA